MSFTVKNLIEDSPDIPIEKRFEYRSSVGLIIRSRFTQITGKYPSKISEDGMMVCEYDDDFKDTAREVAREFIQKKLTKQEKQSDSIEPVVSASKQEEQPVLRKRKRIAVLAYSYLNDEKTKPNI